MAPTLYVVRKNSSLQAWRWLLVVGIVSAAGLAIAGWMNRPIAEAQDGERGASGQEIFRFHTFGDEQLWTDRLRMHEVIESTLDPTTALLLGLKVDVDALPEGVRAGIKSGDVDLGDPATTVTLIKLNAVVGVVGKVEQVDGRDRLTEVGITCALCHSTVDDSFFPGIGRRLDGWPNLDLDPGQIIAASPAVTEENRAVYNSWGPGFYDPRFNIDGESTPLVLPPAYGLAGVDLETYTGEGPISYWNRYVAVTQMGGHGSFSDPRLGINIVQEPDLVAPRLPRLLDYQLSLTKPSPPAGSFDRQAAKRGQVVFGNAGKCATCHIPPLLPRAKDVKRGTLRAIIREAGLTVDQFLSLL